MICKNKTKTVYGLPSTTLKSIYKLNQLTDSLKIGAKSFFFFFYKYKMGKGKKATMDQMGDKVSFTETI